MKPYLEHVNITTTSIDELVVFLQTAVPQWKVRNGSEGSEKNCRWLHMGSDENYIAIEERDGPDKSPHQAYFHPGLNHYGIVVENVESLMERMIGAGYSEGAHVLEHPFRKRCYFFDHDGAEWEFVEYLSEVPSEMNDYSDML
ncbi:MAG: VOC family protein [Candidatus Poseidoniaceae archaeon]|nr:VOC family protein [Candidatus Poseidoniaceae archaeon]